jgi:hypothetical protein
MINQKIKNKLILEEGHNEIRIITLPFKYYFHSLPNKLKVICCLENCPLCDINSNKQRYLLGCISRKLKTYKILDISTLLYHHIRQLVISPKFGDPFKYDIDIIIDRNKGPASYCIVEPLSPEPLSIEDQKIKNSIDVEELNAIIAPMESIELKRLMLYY